MAKIIEFLGANADDFLLITGSFLISAFIIFMIMYLMERRLDVSSIKKLGLYLNLSALLFLIGLYQLFTYFVMKETDPNNALSFYRLSYLVGIPTIPIFLNVVLSLTIERYMDIQKPASRIKHNWRRWTKRIWWPMWILAGIAWVSNTIDIFANTDLFLTARSESIPKSFIPLVGAFSSKWSLLGVSPFVIIWGVAILLSVSMVLAYIIRVIWFDKPEWFDKTDKGEHEKDKSDKDKHDKIRVKTNWQIFFIGLFDKKPTVKWVKTFSVLSLLTFFFLMYQGINGYQWENSFPIAAYSNLFVFFAIIFILIGEVFGAREEVIRAYSNAFISNINTRGNITLSHETGTPLWLVRELFQRLGRDLKRNIDDESFTFSKEVSKEYLAELKEIEGPLNTLARIADDLRKRAGIFKTNPVPVSLGKLIAEVKKTAELSTRGKDIRFKIIPDEKKDTVKIDPDQMNVILRNL